MLKFSQLFYLIHRKLQIQQEQERRQGNAAGLNVQLDKVQIHRYAADMIVVLIV